MKKALTILLLLAAITVLSILAMSSFSGCEPVSIQRDISVDQEVRAQKVQFNAALDAFVMQRDLITRGYVRCLREKVMLDSLINQASREGRDLKELLQKRLENKEWHILLNAQDAEYKSHIEIIDEEMKDWDKRHPGWWK